MSLQALSLSALALLVTTPASASRLFVSTERPFAPDLPGAILKIEVRGARSVDVRLYRLADPERFFASQKDLRHPEPVEVATRPDGRDPQRPARRPPPRSRTPGPFALLGRALEDAAMDARDASLSGLSPAAGALLRAAARAPRRTVAPPSFLRGLDLVDRWDLPCGGAGAEFSYCDLDLGPRPSGVYLVEATSEGDVAHAVALFTRLALVSRRTAEQLVVLATDSLTGQAIPQAQIAVYSQGKELSRGVTGKQGLFTLKAPRKPLLVVGQRGADTAVVSSSHFAVELPERHTYLATDRGDVRPGERVAYFGLSRAGQDGSSLPRDEEAEVALHDARGSLIEKKTHALSPQGAFTGDVVLPAGLPQGVYRLVATVDGRASGAELVVRSFPLPSFAVSASLEGKRAGEPLLALMEAAAEGGPVSGARFSFRLSRLSLGEEGAATEIDRGEAVAGADGRATVSMPTAGDADARYELAVLARDARGRPASAVARTTILRGPVRVSLSTVKRVSPPGASAEIACLVQTADDRPAEAVLKLRVRATKAGGDAARQVLSQEVRSGKDGRGTLAFTPTAPGYYEIEAASGGIRLAETFLYVTAEGGDIPFTPESLRLLPDRGSYSVGDTARVLLLAPFDAATALVTVEAEQPVRAEAVTIRGSSAVLSVKVTPALAAGFTVAAQAVFNERTFKREVALFATNPPAGDALSVKGVFEAVAGSEARLTVEVLDRAGRPVPGAEVHASARDARGLSPPAPALASFFHPARGSEGNTAGSTSFRNSSASRALAPSAMDGLALEGPLPFKELLAAPPRGRDRGTVATVSAVTDAKGRALFRFTGPADVPRLSVRVRAALGSALGEWGGEVDRGLPAMGLLAPAFLREGDEAQVTAEVHSGRQPLALSLESDDGEAESDVVIGPQRLTLPVVGTGDKLRLVARFSPLGEIRQTLDVLPSVADAVRGESGVQGPGRGRLPDARAGERSTLYLASTAAAAARAARPCMGDEPEPMTLAAVGRVLSRVASLRAGEPRGDGAQLDSAALAGLSRPEGGFGAYDGAPPTLHATAFGLIALKLAQRQGVEIEDGVLSRTAARLLENSAAREDPLVTYALALSEEPVGPRLSSLLAAETKPGLSLEGRALMVLALVTAGEETAAGAAAERLEQAARLEGTGACFARSCAELEVGRADLRATALGALALASARPHSVLLPSILRTLGALRGRGDFGGDESGGLAALALATAGGKTPARKVHVSVESGGRRVAVVALKGDEEHAIALPSGDAAVTVTGGPIYWRLERRTRAPRAGGPLAVSRVIHPLSGGDRLRVGERADVILTLTATSATGPLRIDDPYPAGLHPLEQEGEKESHRQRSEHARRLILPDRVVFLLPSLPSGETVLRWEAAARVAGRYTAAPVRVSGGDAFGQSVETPLVIGEGP